MRYLKYISCAFTFLILSLAFSSCSDDAPAEVSYSFGITSASSTSSKEITAINSAYTDAFHRAGLDFGSNTFRIGTTKDVILKACIEAEGAMASSTMKFDASYTYEVFEIASFDKVMASKECIYRKVYGVSQ